MVFSCFKLVFTHISPCKFLESFENSHFGTKKGEKGVQNEFFQK